MILVHLYSIIKKWRAKASLLGFAALFSIISINAKAQQFYFGCNQPPFFFDWNFSFYRYKLNYQNFPYIYGDQPAFRFDVSTNAYNLGYKFNNKNSVELFYNEQFYQGFKDIQTDPFAFTDLLVRSKNIGLSYKRTFLSVPVNLGFRKLKPFKMSYYMGASYQINQPHKFTDTFEQMDLSTNKVLALISRETSSVSSPQVLLHAGVEIEVPLYKSISLTLQGGYFAALGGIKYVNSSYKGFDSNGTVDGNRYTDGSAINYGFGLRWYLPGKTDSVTVDHRSQYFWGIEYIQFANSNSGWLPRRDFFSNSETAGLVFGRQIGKNVIETALLPLASNLSSGVINIQTSFSNYASYESRLYLPLRYKRIVPLVFANRQQRLELMPIAGVGFHLPVIISKSSSYTPNGDLAEEFQKVNPFVLGLETGAEMAIRGKNFSLSGHVRYLKGLSHTRELLRWDLDSNQPTSEYISSTPTGWQKGISMKFFISNKK